MAKVQKKDKLVGLIPLFGIIIILILSWGAMVMQSETVQEQKKTIVTQYRIQKEANDKNLELENTLSELRMKLFECEQKGSQEGYNIF